MEHKVKTIEITADELNMLQSIRNYLGSKELPFNETAPGNLFLDKFINKIKNS